ncbi:acetyl-CoA C-acetyltransferase [Novosphingobium sp. PhB165]|uniref:acetyl-CoA C-acyltransferase n=1 Tax=Novosphingobium sp. PhB165 TaxID=2485105 RepID=UPI0010485D07|nr:acetyl-CoA C-acyltransferase [Novosphingobium sp. PhB165]TCM12728.1 acetyl-CoA C-acetyltransferase [Novosphingobium sp. PhB165]
MSEAYIVSAVRTASGRRNGRLAAWHPALLGASVLNEVVRRADIDSTVIEDVIMGCVNQGGEQTADIARNAVISSNLPLSIPGVTVDRQCGSSQQAVQFAVQAILSGMQDVVIAAGVESMTRVPMKSTTAAFAEVGLGSMPLPDSGFERLGTRDISQFNGAELMVKKYGFTRDDLERFALESHSRASAAIREGRFNAEILPLSVDPSDPSAQIHREDEGVRHDASLESMKALRTLSEGGTITAATSSQIADGASAVLLASADAVKQHNLTPIARIVGSVAVGGDPVMMLDETPRATQLLLRKLGMRFDDIDLYEVNEAFAPVPLSWLKVMAGDPKRLNVNGGALSLGHPLGASGTKLMTTLIHALRSKGGRYGLQTMCEGGGQANATIIEVL